MHQARQRLTLILQERRQEFLLQLLIPAHDQRSESEARRSDGQSDARIGGIQLLETDRCVQERSAGTSQRFWYLALDQAACHCHAVERTNGAESFFLVGFL